MTSEDHNSSALIAALRSPALPEEQVGEAAAISAMLEVLAVYPARHGLRSRRSLAIAAVTVASLGVGGLAAAGPGIFQAAYNKVSTIGEQRSSADDLQTSETQTDQDGQDRQDRSGTQSDGNGSYDAVSGEDPAADRGSTTDGIECADGDHGDTVTSVVQASESGQGKGQIVNEAARSDCGQPADEVSEDSSGVDNGKHIGQTSADDQSGDNPQPITPDNTPPPNTNGGGNTPPNNTPPPNTNGGGNTPPNNTPPNNTPPPNTNGGGNTPPPNTNGGGNGDGDG